MGRLPKPFGLLFLSPGVLVQKEPVHMANQDIFLNHGFTVATSVLANEFIPISDRLKAKKTPCTLSRF